MLKHIFYSNIKPYKYVSIIFVSFLFNNVSSYSPNPFKLMPKNYTQLFISKTNETFTKITNPNTSPLSKEEIDYLNSNYIYNIYSNETYSALFKYSSRSFNEITTFSSCLKYRTSNNTSYTYITVQITAINTHGSFDNNLNKISTFGVCIVKKGIYNNTKAIGNILNAVNDATDNFFTFNNKSIQIFEMTHQTKVNDSFIVIFFALIPLYVLLLFSSFSLFNSIPKFLFAKCFKKTYKSHNQSSSSQLLSVSNSQNTYAELDSRYSSSREKETNKKNLFLFVACFNCAENIEEVFSTELVTKINNDNGLSYAKGLRGVGMFLMIFGMCYIQLTQVPTKIYEKHKFNEELRNGFFAFFAFSARVSPRLLFSVSGFICVFKYLSFLDEEVEKREEEERLAEEEDSFDKDNEAIKQNTSLNDEGIASLGENPQLEEKNDNIKLDQVFKEGLLLKKNENNQRKITINSAIKFYLYQIHKIIIFLQSIMMFKFCIQRLSIFMGLINPAYVLFFVKYSLSVSILDILEHFFVIGNFNLSQIKRTTTSNNDCILPMFWVVINEIFFFVLTLPIIFISYKKLWKLPWILLVLYLILTALRVLVYYFLINTKENILQNYFDLTTPFGIYSIQPLINWPYYIIGMFFGTLNYALQKGYSDFYNGYLSCSLSIVYFLKSQSKFIIGFFATLEIVFVILLSLMTQISYFVYKGNYDYENEKTLIPNIIHLVDIDIIIILIHLTLISFYVKGGNYLTQKLSSNIWNFANKLYFMFCIFMNFCVTWSYYQSETRICLGMFSYFYYGLINLVMIFIIMFCNCSFLEFPLKRIIQFLKEKNKAKPVETKT